MADPVVFNKSQLFDRPAPQKHKKVKIVVQPEKKKTVAETRPRRTRAAYKKTVAEEPEAPRGVPKIIDKTDEGYERHRFMSKLLKRRGLSVPAPFDSPAQTPTPPPKKPTPPPPKKPTPPPKKPTPPSVTPTPPPSPTRNNEDQEEEEAAPPAPVKAKKRKQKLVLKPSSQTLKKGKKKKKKKTRKEKPPVEIDDELMPRLPVPKPNVLIPASAYFMNNREYFINFINTLFHPYIAEIEGAQDEISCDKKAGDFSLLIHQKIVRDYINNLTPYRGLLLYHGLGSGKTCSAIAIAEGIRTKKKVIIMTPASLKMNFHNELKKCGNPLYKYNQFWEFVSTEGDDEMLEQLHAILHISRAFIKKQGGAWFVNVQKKSNFNDLSVEEHATLDKQLTEMIKHKYYFLNYNGLRMRSLETKSFFSSAIKKKENPFDNRVIIIDEAHNFVSRIINKLKTKKKSISMMLYNYLKSARNSRLIFLTGTPIINYPNEIAVLFNMLRGNITTFTISLTIKSKKRINENFLKTLFVKNGLLVSDYIEYSAGSRKLLITRNPFGFVSDYKSKQYGGVMLNDQGDLTDTDFVNKIHEILQTKNIEFDVKRDVNIDTYTSLPEGLKDFNNKFFDREKNLKNGDLFKRRILGLTSYYRSASEQLLPALNDIVVERIPMSRYQVGVYEEARKQERDREKKDAKKKRSKRKKAKPGEDVFEATSTYRIFSRAFCNFVFPAEKRRPLPKKGEETDGDVGEDVLDNASIDELKANPDGMFSPDDEDALKDTKREQTNQNYGRRISEALKFLKMHSDRLLTKDALAIYSPKFRRMLEIIESTQSIGTHLIYTQFRTLEGIGILKLVLEANGFFEFKLKRNNITWDIEHPEHLGKPSFVLYTGTETAEEKEIIRNIFNSSWKNVPSNIVDQLKPIAENNNHGGIIKIFMITAAGAEGISLSNVRFVHITEPYWHPIRAEQVIGRARRICSHHQLDEEERNVTVFLYLMTFSKELLDEEGVISTELKISDLSKRDNKTPITTDEALYEISEIKREMNQQLLTAIKESSLDCAIYSRSGATEIKTCFSFGQVTPDIFSYVPSIESSAQAKTAMEHKTKQKVQYTKLKISSGENRGMYAKRVYKDGDGEITKVEIYDYKSVVAAQKTGTDPVLLGEVKQNAKKKWSRVVWL